MDKKYIVQGGVTYQTSEDTWERTYKTMIVSEDITVKEIFEWVAKHNVDGLTVRLLPDSK